MEYEVKEGKTGGSEKERKTRLRLATTTVKKDKKVKSIEWMDGFCGKN